MKINTGKICHIFIIMILLVSCGDSEQVKIGKYNSLLEEANKSLQNENYEDVIAKADEALEIYEEYSEPNGYKTIAYYRQDKIRKAIKEAEKIIEKDGEKSFGAKLLAQIYYHKKNKVEKSLQYALLYASAFPDDAENSYLLGNIYYDKKDYSNAVSYFSISVQQQFEIHHSLASRAKSYQALGEFRKSIEDYAFLKKVSDSSEYKIIDFSLAKLYQQTKDYEVSNQMFMKLDSVLSNKYIAQNYRFMDKNDSALDYYNKYISSESTDVEALGERYKLLKELGADNDELFNSYHQMKKMEWKEYNVFLKYLVYIIIPCLLISFLLYKVSHYLLGKQYYDTYNIKTALLYMLGIPIGGAFNYTKNKYVVYLNIILTSILVTYLINHIIFNSGGEYFIELIINNIIFTVLIWSLVTVFIIDLLTIIFRLKKKNVSIRKSLNIKELEDRVSVHNQTMSDIRFVNNELNQIFRR